MPPFVCCGAPRLASPRDLASKTSLLRPLPALLPETLPPRPRPRNLVPAASSLKPLRRPLPATPSLGELSFVVARCVLASRCGLARFLTKVCFSCLFMPRSPWESSSRCGFAVVDSQNHYFNRLVWPSFHIVFRRLPKYLVLSYFSRAFVENDLNYQLKRHILHPKTCFSHSRCGFIVASKSIIKRE